MAWLDSVNGAPRDIFGGDAVHLPPGSSPPDAPRASAHPGRHAGARLDEEESGPLGRRAESEGKRTRPTEAALPGLSPPKGSSRSVCVRNPAAGHRSARRAPPTHRVPAGQEKDKRENPTAAGRRKRKKERSRHGWGGGEELDHAATWAPRSDKKRQREEGRDGQPRGEGRRREQRRDRRPRGDKPGRDEPRRGAGRDGQSHDRDADRRSDRRRDRTQAAAEARPTSPAGSARDEDGGEKRPADGDDDETTGGTDATGSRCEKPPPHGDGKDGLLAGQTRTEAKTAAGEAQGSRAEKFPGHVGPERIRGRDAQSEKPARQFHTRDARSEKLPEPMLSRDSFSEKPAQPLHAEDSYSKTHPEQIHNFDFYSENPTEALPTEDSPFEKLPQQMESENSYSEKPTEPLHTEHSSSERHPEQTHNGESNFEKLPEQIDGENSYSEKPTEQLHARDSYSEKLPERMLSRDSFSEKPAQPLHTEDSYSERHPEQTHNRESYFEKLPEQIDSENSYSEKPTQPLHTDDSYCERHPEQIHNFDYYSENPMEPLHTEDSYSERHPEQTHNGESNFEKLPEQIDGENSYSEKPTESLHTEDSYSKMHPEQIHNFDYYSENPTEPLHTEDSYSERHPEQTHNQESCLEKLPEQIDSENSYSEKPTQPLHTDDSYCERHPEQIHNCDFYSEKPTEPLHTEDSYSEELPEKIHNQESSFEKLPEQIDGENSSSEKPTEPLHTEDSYSERHPEQIHNQESSFEKLPKQIDGENSSSEKPTESIHTGESYSKMHPEQIHSFNFYSENPTEPLHIDDSYSERHPEQIHNCDFYSEKPSEPLRTQDSYSEWHPERINNRESYFEKLPEQIDGENSYSEKPTQPFHTDDSYSERHPEPRHNREPYFEKLPEQVDVENSYSEKPPEQLDTDESHAEKVPEQLHNWYSYFETLPEQIDSENSCSEKPTEPLHTGDSYPEELPEKIHNQESSFETLPEQIDGENSSSEKPTEPLHTENFDSERHPEQSDSVGSNLTPAHLRTEGSSAEKVPAQTGNEDAPFARLSEQVRNGDFDWRERTTPPHADTRDSRRPKPAHSTEQTHAEDSSAESAVQRRHGADSFWENSCREKHDERQHADFSVRERLPKPTDAGVERSRPGDSLPQGRHGEKASRRTCSRAFHADDERKSPQADSPQGLASFSCSFGGVLLRSGVVSLPGSRDRNGRALLTVDAGAGAVWSHPECRGGELLRLMRYYVSTLSVGAPAATVLVDARRAAPAPALLSALEAAREEGPGRVGRVGRVLVLLDEDSDSALRVDPPAQVEVVTSLKRLAQHVDAHQLPPELGGSFRFSHSDWLAFRSRVEQLGSQCEDVIQLLRKNIGIMEDTRLPDTQQGAERQLSVYRELMDEVLADGRLARLQREGAASLSLLLRERGGGGGPSEEGRAAAAAAVWRSYQRVDELLHRLVSRHNGRTRQLRFLQEFGRASAAFAQACGRAVESRRRPAAISAEGDAPAEEHRRRRPAIAEAAFRDVTSLADEKTADARPAGEPAGRRPRSSSVSAETPPPPDGPPSPSAGPRRTPLLRRLFGSAPWPHPLGKSPSLDRPAAPQARRSGPSAARGPSEPARRGNTGVFIRGLEVSGAEAGRRSLRAGTETSPAEGDGRKLRHIVEEMVTTEREYVRSLRYVMAHYFPEMERADLPQDLRGKRSVVFGNLEKLLDFHAHFFLQELEACRKDPLRVAHCFLRHEQLGLYALYSKNKPKSDALLAGHGLAFFKRKQRELGDRMDLCSYLLKPVQRMSKYALLLDDLIKEAGAAREAERRRLRTALAAVRFQLRRGNDLLAMDAIRRCDVNLKEQGRLLRQDRFTVWSGRRKRDRRVFLFDELLLLSKAKKMDGGLEVFEYKRSFKTSDLGLTESRGDDGLRFEIWFRRRTAKNRSLTLQAASAEVKCAWTRELAAILWTQAKRNKETRLKEMLSMGVGDKPYLDIRPSAAAISDRAVRHVARTRGARMRASIAVSASDCAGPFSSEPSSAGLLGSLDLHVMRSRTSGGDVEEDELERDTASQRSVTTDSSGSSSSSRCQSGSTGSDSGCVSSPPRDPSSASSGPSHKAGAAPALGPTTSV